VKRALPPLGDLVPSPSDDLKEKLKRMPIVVSLGGKVYGFSDLPVQYFAPQSKDDCGPVLSLLVSNDSLNTSPELKVQRLFGDLASDSEPPPWRS
jgi:hypothetical protein